MLVRVKKPHTEFTVEGTIPEKVMDFLERNYTSFLSIEEEERWIDVDAWEEHRKYLEVRTPGKTLRFYRQLADMTQTQLAEKLGMKKQYISDLERDRRPISRKMAHILGAFFSIPPGRFVC